MRQVVHDASVSGNDGDLLCNVQGTFCTHVLLPFGAIISTEIILFIFALPVLVIIAETLTRMQVLLVGSALRGGGSAPGAPPESSSPLDLTVGVRFVNHAQVVRVAY